MSEILLQPLEQLAKLALPNSLDGSQGCNRAAGKVLIKAENDLEAIQAWLAEYQNKPATTYNHYRKDAERLLLWALTERNKPLSGLNAEDLLAYSQFLDNPTPFEKWCSGSKLNSKRWEKDWKPFVGPLSPAAKGTAFANLTSLFNYLVEINYLAQNPFKAVRRQLRQRLSKGEERSQRAKRILSLNEWQAILDTLQAMSEDNLEEYQEKVRLKFILALLFFTSLRIEELTSHGMNAFKNAYDYRAQKERWWLEIKGKGDKLRQIPVNQSLIQSLKEYRRSLNLSELPTHEENEPLVRSFRTKGTITARRVNQLLKALAEKAALLYEKKEPGKITQLRDISAHWIRHYSLSMQDLVNIKKQHIKENAGHESERTTELYVHSVDDMRHEEMEKLSWEFL